MSSVLLCKRYQHLGPCFFLGVPILSQPTLLWTWRQCCDSGTAPNLTLSLMQIATTRRLTVHFNPPSSCVLEISVRGVKIGVKADEAQEAKVTSFKPLPSCPMHVSSPLFLA